MLLIDAAGEEASVDCDDFAVNKTRGVGGEKDRGACKLVDVTEAFHRCAQKKLASTIGFVKQLLIERGAKDAGRYGVHAHATAGPLDRQ